MILESNSPDLNQYNFDNQINYCCYNGIWILYEDYDYNAHNYKVFPGSSFIGTIFF
jgi:hypothetical protein